MSDSWRQCEGQVVEGGFQLVKHLGGSDHSVVFLTERDKNKPEKAVIKFIQRDAAKAELQLFRWKQAAQLSHPNLIRLFETGRCHLAGMDLLYIVMEYASENLAHFLPQRPLTPEETRDMLEPLLDTLMYLHGRGFAHDRIKPGNILAVDAQLKLSSDSLCRGGEVRVGIEKPDAYSAPESAAGKTSAAGDVWSLGMTLVETLTQRLPERSASQAPEQEELPVEDTLPQPFLDIARHSLQRAPQRRWTVGEISTRLNPAAAPPAPTTSAPAPSDEEPAAANTAPTASAVASTPIKPLPSIDPLAIPLSTVPPRSTITKHALENQMIAGRKAPARPYYILVAVVLALTLGAVLAIPRFRSRRVDSEPASSAAASQPTRQPAAPASATATPSAPTKAQPKSEQNTANPGADQSPQRFAAQPTEEPGRSSAQSPGEKQPTKKDQPSAATAPASLRSDLPQPDAAPVAPLIANRDAGIAAGAVTPGEALNQVLPEVSERSRRTIRGTVRVIIKVQVDSSGSVAAAEVASGPSRYFADAALQVARRWDFAPAKMEGHAVPSEWLLHFDFTQTGTKVTSLPTKP
jgi:TonB family protein